MSTTSRRSFLLSTGAALVSAAPASGIVDTHIHLYDPRRPQGVPWPPKNDALLYRPVIPPDFAALVRPLGVTRTVVVEASAWVEDNQWILDLAKDNRMVVGHVGHLTPGAAEFRQHLGRFGKNPLFRGIRLNGGAITAGVESPGFIEDLQRLSDAGLMLDAIGNASMIPSLIQLTEKVKGLRIAIDHMPGEPPGWTDRRGELRELARNPRVYSKVSGVMGHRELLDEVWQMFTSDRVMFGSNWPVCERVAPYVDVLKLMKDYLSNKDAATSEKYFWRNSQACYQWVDRV
jgi:predicted TIM-barrel fold metal-dependent hydrolase